MVVLIVLAVGILVARAVGFVGVKAMNSWPAATRLGLAAMLFFTATAHFTPMRRDLAQMVPPWIPRPEAVVLFTGTCEILGAIGLLLPRTRSVAAVALILFLVPPEGYGRPRRSRTLVDREIANYTRAVAKGDFSSLEQALTAPELRRSALQAEMARLEPAQQPAVVQLTLARLERHLQGMTETPRSGVSGKVREAIQQSVARILVGVDGTVTLRRQMGNLWSTRRAPQQSGARFGFPLSHRVPWVGEPPAR